MFKIQLLRFQLVISLMQTIKIIWLNLSNSNVFLMSKQ